MASPDVQARPWIDTNEFTRTGQRLSGRCPLALLARMSDMLTDGEIAQILGASAPLTETSQALVDAANAAGGRDNISVILAQSDGEPPAGARSWWRFRR